MSLTAILGDASDGYLESSSTSYSSALSGSNLIVPGNASPLMFHGQSVDSGVRYVWQSFLRVDWAADTDATPVAAYLRVQAGSTTGTRQSRNLEFRAYNWGASVGTGDWRTPAQLSALDMPARIVDANQAGSLAMRAGLDLDELDTTGEKRYVACSSRNRLQQAPVTLEWQTLRQAETSNSVSQRPALYATSTAKHHLDLSLGAQVQLSDGTHVYLEQDDTAPGPLIFSVVHHDGTTATVIDTLSSVAARRGAQTVAVCRDDNDRVYVANDNSSNRLIIRAYTRTGGSWAQSASPTATLPTYSRRVNNLVMAWHPQGGTEGTIVALIGREAADNTGTQLAYALINCDHIITGSGSLLRGAGSADGTLVDASAVSGFNNFANETGTLADLAAARDANGDVSNRGFATCTAKHQTLGQRTSQSIGRYQLSADGTSISTARTLDSTSGYAVKDADAKARLLPVSASQFVTVHVSDSDEFGIVVKHRQQTPGTSGFTVLADVRLDALGLATMDEPSVLATSSAWDAVYDPITNLVWVYYLDAADGQRLMKTHVDLTTGLAAADEVEVSAAVGAVGSTNHAIRVHRGESSGQQVLISVANEDTGVQSMVYVVEEINLTPDAPQLVVRANFDATTPVTFEWTFRDPNPSDSQGAYQVEVWDDTTDTLVHDTGKVVSTDEFYDLPASTLTNGESYRWRARTWDAADEEGPYSSFSFFATSASGNVTVVHPATDHEPLETADLQIEWEVTGASQDDYRVVVVATADESTLSDTGWVTSADVTYTVTGMLSETEYRIEVTIRDTGVESSTGTRLVTPDYTSPVAPVLTLTPVGENAYMRVSVDNPAPGESLATLDGTFEDGVDGWDVDPANQLIGAADQNSFADTTNVSVPAGTADGDLMFLWAVSNFDETITPPAGWTLQESTIFGSTGASDQHGVWLYTRVADTEPGSYGITWGSTQWHSAAIVTTRHTSAFGGWSITTVDTGTSVAVPQISVEPGDWLLVLGHTAESGTRSIDPALAVVVNPDRGVFVAYEVSDTSGLSGAYTLDIAGTADAMAAAALRVDESVHVEQSDEQAFGGTYSAKLTVAGTPALAGIRPAVVHRVEAEENERYTVSYWAYSPLGHTVRSAIDFYDESGDLISSSFADAAVPVAEWTLMEHSASAPLGTDRIGYGPSLVTPTDTMVLYVDNLDVRTATDVPAPTANQIWRTHNGGAPVLVATIDPGTSYRDYLVGSGREYGYHAVALTADGATTTSNTAAGVVEFLGVWLHDPADPEGTIRQYLYGKAQRSDDTTVDQVSHHFVGRPNPVTYFGENETSVWNATVDLPEGPDRMEAADSLRAWATARRTIVGRDNRGRVYIATMGDLPVGDQNWGDQVSFTLTRVSSDLPGGER